MRLIDIPDRFLGAGRGIGIWISLVSALVVGAGLLEARKRSTARAQRRPESPDRPAQPPLTVIVTVSTGASVEGWSVRTPVLLTARLRRVLDRPADHEAGEKDGDQDDERQAQRLTAP